MHIKKNEERNFKPVASHIFADKIRFYHMNNSCEALGMNDVMLALLGQFVVIIKGYPSNINRTDIDLNEQALDIGLYKYHLQRGREERSVEC